VDFEQLNKSINKHRDKFPLDLEMTSFTTTKICSVAKNQGYTSTYSKKAKLFLKNKAFCCEWKNGILIYKLVDSFLRKDGITEEIRTLGIHLLSISTNNGIIYVTKTNSHIICWTAHFFDRYSERINKQLSRNDSIKEYMKNQLIHGNLIDSDNIKNGVIRYFCKDGIALGETNGQIVLYKTFVSNDMFNYNQHKILKNKIIKTIENSNPHIEEEKFIKMLMEKDEQKIINMLVDNIDNIKNRL